MIATWSSLFWFFDCVVSRLKAHTDVKHQAAHVQPKCSNSSSHYWGQEDMEWRQLLMDQVETLQIPQSHLQKKHPHLLSDAIWAKAANYNAQIAENFSRMTCWRITWGIALVMISWGQMTRAYLKPLVLVELWRLTSMPGVLSKLWSWCLVPGEGHSMEWIVQRQVVLSPQRWRGTSEIMKRFKIILHQKELFAENFADQLLLQAFFKSWGLNIVHLKS